MRGRFIVLDGPDGSGTTLHSRLLSERLQKEGNSVLATAEPSSGVIGTSLRTMLKSGELSGDALQLLFTADRADHIHHAIEPALKEGMSVVCDRYISSTIAYGEALNLDTAWLENMNKKFIQADALIFLLPPINVIMERLAERKSHESLETHEMQERVHMAYTRMAQQDSSIVVIDTSGKKEEVAEKIWQSVVGLRVLE